MICSVWVKIILFRAEKGADGLNHSLGRGSCSWSQATDCAGLVCGETVDDEVRDAAGRGWIEIR